MYDFVIYHVNINNSGIKVNNVRDLIIMIDEKLYIYIIFIVEIQKKR